MPNWCEQDLRIKGPTKIVKAFKEEVNGPNGPLDHDKIYPMPAILTAVTAGSEDTVYNVWYGPMEESLRQEEMKKIRNRYKLAGKNADKVAELQKLNKQEYGYINWYDWANAHWGTKWGICHSSLLDEKLGPRIGRLMYTFESAWAPAAGIIKKASSMWPDLEFDLKYYERGMEYKGHMTFSAGKTIHFSEGTYRGSRGG